MPLLMDISLTLTLFDGLCLHKLLGTAWTLKNTVIYLLSASETFMPQTRTRTKCFLEVLMWHCRYF